MQLTVGRSVHYYGDDDRFPFGGGPYVAIVLAANEGEPPVFRVMTPFGDETLEGIPYSETPKPGHWNWPPRV